MKEHETQPAISRADYLNILPKHQRWLDLVNQDGQTVENTTSPRYQALPMDFGHSHFSDRANLRAREALLDFANGHESEQFTGFVASTVFNTEVDRDWSVILNWLRSHPYALKTGDVERAMMMIKREKIDIEYDLDLQNQSAGRNTEDYIGPHRYVETASFLAQTHIAAEEGINCQVLVHAVAEFLGSPLPRQDRSKELFEKDTYRFIDLENEAFPIGAVLFFHERPVITEPAALHLAVYVGTDMAGVPWLLQATSQLDKMRPAAELVSLSKLLTGRQRFFYGAVEICSNHGNIAVSDYE